MHASNMPKRKIQRGKGLQLNRMKTMRAKRGFSSGFGFGAVQRPPKSELA